MGQLQVKRVYDTPSSEDGCRVLVDRLWPRGLSKERAQVDWWAKELAPTTELRQWFGHDPARWEEFQARYRAELQDKGEWLQLLREKAAAGPVTLVYGSRDTEHNGAKALCALFAQAKR